MGVLFSRAKVSTATTPDGSTLSTVQEYTDADHPELTPLVGIKRYTDEGRARKIAVPFTTKSSSGDIDMIEYKTVWQPIGQEGWIEKFQTTLKRIDDSYDEIYKWLTVDTGQILLVRSNQVNQYGEEDTELAPYDRLEEQSLWFVDKITIVSRTGTSFLADMELALVRCWQYDTPV